MLPTYVNMRTKEVSVRIDALLTVTVIGMMLIGCGRCVECSYQSGGSETICESEFDSVSQYDLAVDNAEANGATCSASGGGF